MLENEFRDFLEYRKLADDWWIAVDDTVLDSTMTLMQVKKLRSELPDAEILLLHPTDAKKKEPDWRPYEGHSNPKQRLTANPEAAKQIKVLESRVEFLQNTVDAILNMLAELDSFENLRKALEDRTEFIHRSEEELINRTIEIEQKTAELEQRLEDSGQG